MSRLATPRHSTTSAPAQPRISPVDGAHPWAWWAWAILSAICISFTWNPLLIVLVLSAVLIVALLRRSEHAWARSIGIYIKVALWIIGMRILFRIVLGGESIGGVLFTLPQLQLPQWAAGITLGGPVTSGAVLGSLYDGLRLAGIVLCVAAANTLANPRTALKSVPVALQRMSVALVVAFSVAPQLIAATARVRTAQRLRTRSTSRWRIVHALLVPVLTDALERSMTLAIAMESRGFGRDLNRHPATGFQSSPQRHTPVSTRLVTALLLAAIMALVAGTFFLFTTSATAVFRVPTSGEQWAALVRLWGLLLVGLVLAIVALRLAGRGRATSRYRPQRWRWYDSLTVGCGLAAVIGVQLLALQHPAAVNPPILSWPVLDPIMAAVFVILALPGWLTPAPRKGT